MCGSCVCVSLLGEGERERERDRGREGERGREKERERGGGGGGRERERKRERERVGVRESQLPEVERNYPFACVMIVFHSRYLYLYSLCVFFWPLHFHPSIWLLGFCTLSAVVRCV